MVRCLLMRPLFLASQSPRRRELLKKSGFSFCEFPVKVSEIPDKNLNLDAQILDIARRKSHAALESLMLQESGPFTVLGADTVVVLQGQILGKPKDSAQAYDFLKQLSGRWHEVKTAVVVIYSPEGTEKNEVVTTRILFKNLSHNEITTYVQTGDPMDKAGAYGIQNIGNQFVEKIEGPYDNVVGLPMQAVSRLIK